jgi:hypothetical protein
MHRARVALQRRHLPGALVDEQSIRRDCAG